MVLTVVLVKTLESPLDCKEIQPVHPKGNQSWVFIGRTDAEAETPILGYLMPLLKRPLCWERLRAGGEGDNRGWDAWMASPTRWTWLGGLQELMMVREAWHAVIHGVAKIRTWLSDWTELNWTYTWLLFSINTCCSTAWSVAYSIMDGEPQIWRLTVKFMQIFNYMGISTPNLHIVQGSLVYPNVRRSEHIAVVVLISWGTSIMLSTANVPLYIATNKLRSLSSHRWQHLLLVVFLIIVILCVRW